MRDLTYLRQLIERGRKVSGSNEQELAFEAEFVANAIENGLGGKDFPAHVIVRLSESQLVALMAAIIVAPALYDRAQPDVWIQKSVEVARRIREFSKDEP